MADTTLLRTSAIVRNATVAPPQHGPVKTGALPLVQVKMVPGGPQVQNGQQKAVEILPPRDAASAVAIGGLPMVQVKMTQNGPHLEDGRDHAVVIKDPKHSNVSSGGLPMIQVKMDGGKPQIQTLPNIQGGPPRIPAAAPALSAQRGAQGAPARQVVAAPRQVAARQLPLVPELSSDQLMLCRHLVEKYLVDLRANNASATSNENDTSAEVAETSTSSENIKLAEATIFTLDEAMIATAVRAAAAEEAAAAPTVAPTMRTVSVSASSSIAPAPTVSHVAGRVVGRPQGFTMGARTQRNSGMAPRRVARPGSPLPPVIVNMNGKQPVVQNQVEIEQAKSAIMEIAPEPTIETPQG